MCKRSATPICELQHFDNGADCPVRNRHGRVVVRIGDCDFAFVGVDSRVSDCCFYFHVWSPLLPWFCCRSWISVSRYDLSMSENEFRRLVARVERAASHRHELWSLGAEHLKANPIERRVVSNGDIRSFRLHATAPVPTELSLIFGEWLYQLRAALDGLMYEIVVRETKLDPPPNAGRISYPLCRSADAFASCNTYGVSDRLRRAIERTQPYHATGGFSGSALWCMQSVRGFHPG